MFERMLLYMLYLCRVTGTDPPVLRAKATALTWDRTRENADSGRWINLIEYSSSKYRSKPALCQIFLE
jgi:hypothetical protein